MKITRIIFLSVTLLIILSACTSTASPEPDSSTPASGTVSFTLQDFDAALKSKGLHGAMVCYSYAGSPEDLEGLTLTARILRGEEIVEKRIPSEVVDGEPCFEITDAKYVSISPNQDGGRLIIPDQPLSIRIDAKLENNEEILNNYQVIELGKYEQYPFLAWIFPEGTEPGCLAGGHERDGMHYPAWDFIPKPTEAYPSIVGTPVLAPVDGFFYLTSFSKDENPHEKVNMIMIYSPDTGFLINLTHVYDLVFLDGEWVMLDELIGKEVSSGQTIGAIAPKDFVSTVPHTHLQILIPPDPINTSRVLTPGEMNEIYTYLIDNDVPNLDFIAEKMFIDPVLNDELSDLSETHEKCEDYSWGEINFLQQLPFTIDGVADDWADYEAVLSGSSDTGSEDGELDLSELYLAEDENYLYLMLKTGKKPAEVSTDWTFYFHLDLFVENECATSERMVKIWSENPHAFEVYSLDKCDYTVSKHFPADYVWDEVLEIRILRAYLKNPPHTLAIDSSGYLINPLNQDVIQDRIP